MNPEEKELISQCLKQDRLAQKKLYDSYKRAMYTLAYRITGNFEMAADCLQDGFVQVFKSLESFKGTSTIGAWIKTIIIRTAYKHIHKTIIFEALPPQYNDEKLDWNCALDTEYLEKAIQSLPEGFRLVFTLIEIEGYTHREVAELLNISEGTSKSQLFHAKKRLRDILSGD